MCMYYWKMLYSHTIKHLMAHMHVLMTWNLILVFAKSFVNMTSYLHFYANMLLFTHQTLKASCKEMTCCYTCDCVYGCLWIFCIDDFLQMLKITFCSVTCFMIVPCLCTTVITLIRSIFLWTILLECSSAEYCPAESMLMNSACHRGWRLIWFDQI